MFKNEETKCTKLQSFHMDRVFPFSNSWQCFSPFDSISISEGEESGSIDGTVVAISFLKTEIKIWCRGSVENGR